MIDAKAEDIYILIKREVRRDGIKFRQGTIKRVIDTHYSSETKRINSYAVESSTPHRAICWFYDYDVKVLTTDDIRTLFRERMDAKYPPKKPPRRMIDLDV